MAIYDFFVSRNGAVSNAAAYIGHAGRLFYDSDNGVVKLSDGVTPGGTSIPYTIASTTVVGGIKAGPGANIAVDGTLTIDTSGLPLSIGNLQISDTTILTLNANDDLVLASNGTGNVELRGNVHFHTTADPSDTPFFTASNDGQITVLVPATDPLAGAFKIVGSETGRVSPPVNTGVMLQVTGNNNIPSRIYNDSINSFAAFVGRRINGNLSVPTAVQAGDELIRISSTGYNGTTIPGAGSARIVYQAKETYTSSAQGSNISIWATQIGANTLSKIATFDVESGATFTKATVQGNLTVSSNVAVTNTVSARNYSGQARDAGTLGAAGTLTIDFATDHNVLVNLTTTATIAFTNITAGKTVTVLVKNATGVNRAVTLGVTADNTSGGNDAPNVNNGRTGVFVYRSFGATTANVYCEVN